MAVSSRGGREGHEPRARILDRQARAWALSIQGWTQVRIARELGVSQPAVTKMLRRAAHLMADDVRKNVIVPVPSCTADLIKPFYDFPFGTWAEPGERRLVAGRHVKNGLGDAVGLLEKGSAIGLTLPTPDGGPPLEDDQEIADLAVKAARTLLECQAEYWMGGKRATLRPEDIGLCATHHVMNAAMALRLDRRMAGLAIDTPERWQGLERKVMIIVHPLSGVTQPSEFDLATGRLCVMASRHQVALLVVTRDHLMPTLETHLPVADQPIGRADASGAGHSQNLSFWSTLRKQGRIVAL